IAPTMIPPTMPVTIPAAAALAGGTPDAREIPMHNGNATRNTIIEAGRSRLRMVCASDSLFGLRSKGNDGEVSEGIRRCLLNESQLSNQPRAKSFVVALSLIQRMQCPQASGKLAETFGLWIPLKRGFSARITKTNDMQSIQERRTQTVALRMLSARQAVSIEKE